MKSHWIDDNTAIDAEELERQGVYYAALPLDDYQPTIDSLKASKGYIQQDEINIRPDTPGLDELLKKFDDEHLHDEDEVRFVLEGEGIFDIRSSDDRWMRVRVEPGDLIVVPGGRYHRFELTPSRTMQCVRLFQDVSGWVPKYRAS